MELVGEGGPTHTLHTGNIIIFGYINYDSDDGAAKAKWLKSLMLPKS
jgi:hypothetical protein